MSFKVCLMLFIAVLTFTNCASQNINNDNPHLFVENAITPIDVNPYILAHGEQLATFIDVQNRMNRYARFEHFPTDEFLREAFDEFEEAMSGIINEALTGISEIDGISEIQSVVVTIEDFFNIFRRIAFMYNINFDRTHQVWELELIGRSTTLFIEFTSDTAVARNAGLRLFNNVMPSVNAWMSLNNIPSLDAILRLHLNPEFDIIVAELFGSPL